VSHSTTELLHEALTHFDMAIVYSQSPAAGQMAVDAMCLRLAAGIETLARLDAVVREEIFGDDWPLMWGLRNRIAHGYTLVSLSIIHETLAVDVPHIVALIEAALADSVQPD
jgi:uncharacterized protein with HEPN domain